LTIGLRTSWRHISAELGGAIIPSTDNGSKTAPYFGVAGRL
jgi:hypothetical protein